MDIQQRREWVAGRRELELFCVDVYVDKKKRKELGRELSSQSQGYNHTL